MQREALLAGEPLDRSDAASLMSSICDAELTPEQIAEVLVALRRRMPALEEIQGFHASIIERAVPLRFPDSEFVDLCGSGGDGKNTFNISTAAAFVVAAAGYPVVKHGNYGFSSSAGSSNVLEALGVIFPLTQSQARAMLERSGIVFLHAPHWHPALKAVQPIRKSLGFRTIFNILGPLLNPAKPRRQLVGAHSIELQDLYAACLQEAGSKFSIIHSLDGYDEFSLTGAARLLTEDTETELAPSMLDLQPVPSRLLAGGSTPVEAAATLIELLEGKEPSARIAVVAANAALAIRTLSPRALSFRECFDQAQETILSGRAFKVLRSLTSSDRIAVPVSTPTILEKITLHKREEIQERRKAVPIEELKNQPQFAAPRVSLRQALTALNASGVIAEIKRRSPSRSTFREHVDPAALASGYVRAGASAISVLTDEHFFGGSLADLQAVRSACPLPILRKDFMLDEYQLFEARAFGADVILLIAAILTSDEVQKLSRSARSLGLEVLLEVHSKAEIDSHCCDTIDLIGVNNRNLHNFNTTIERSLELFSSLPTGLVAISESGIRTTGELSLLREAGYQGFLIGETFMCAADPANACAALIGGDV